jgi:hypothetical protein
VIRLQIEDMVELRKYGANQYEVLVDEWEYKRAKFQTSCRIMKRSCSRIGFKSNWPATPGVPI